MRDWTDVMIRVRGAFKTERLQSWHEVEAQRNGTGVWQGESTIDLAKADPGRSTEADYGIELGRQLINPAVERALVFAGAGNGVPVRVRLFLEGEAARLHNVVWERMHLRLDENQAAWPIATAPHIAFSRYIPVEIPDEVPMDEPAFRLLIVVSNPSDVGDKSLDIKVADELGAFVTEFEKASMPARLAVTVMPGRTGIPDELAGRMRKLGWEVEWPGAASLKNVAAVASRKRSHGIHVLAHGNFKGGRSQGFLYLEKEDGTKDEVVDDSLRTWIGPQLRLVVLQACKSGARVAAGREDPFVGLAAKLVRYGVPAVVAMQDLVAMDDARVFVAAFYRELMQDGFVDHAVNEGRRAMESANGEWWIPAVYQRLTNGRLWCADPVRDEVWSVRRRIATPPDVPDVLPIQVVQDVNGLRFNPADAPVGPVFDLHSHALKLLRNERHVCITGPSGSNKTEQLQLLYCQLADEFLKDSLQNAAPVWLGMSELAGHKRAGSEEGDRLREALKQTIAGGSVALFLANRRFVFLIDADEDLAPAEMRGALRCLSGLMGRLRDSSCVMVMQESELGSLQVLFPDTKVFVAKPLDLPVLRGFLMTTGNESDAKLRELIDERGLGDLAAAPWLLSQMRDLMRFGHSLHSRAAVMELVAENFLSGFGNRGIPRRCALEAMCGIAWAMQYSRCRTLPDTEVWKILDAVRGKREFRITELRDALMDGNLLFAAGEDAAGLSYKAIRSYFAARYLYEAPNSAALLEDITASLGRHSRLRHWQETLIMFAGMQRTTAERVRVLNAVLAGSSLLEGDQVLLAARLYVEMRKNELSKESELARSPVVRQIVDTLIWRSRPDVGRPYQMRRRALEGLASMRHVGAVPHMVELAFEEVEVAGDGKGIKTQKRFDFSGIRMRAVAGLLELACEISEEMKASCEVLRELLDAWDALLVKENVGPMLAILEKNRPSESAVAAFAFALVPNREESSAVLLRMLHGPQTDEEVIWAINEVLGGMETTWLRERVILPWLEEKPAANGRLCYLIQRSAIAEHGSVERQYLLDALHGDECPDRALRALAKVCSAEKEREWLRKACEAVVEGDWEKAQRLAGIRIPVGDEEAMPWRLRHAALEALRDVGNAGSVELLRSVRTKLTNTLSQLSFQVGEEIYWRCKVGADWESI